MTRFTPQWLQSGSYAAAQDRRLIGALWPASASAGCQVSAGTGMTVYVAAGTVAVPTQNGTGTTLCTSDALEQINIAAAPGSGQNRIDLVICRPRGNDLDGGANNDFIFDTVQGAQASSPAVPATPAGTTALAQVYVGGGVAAIGGGNITDVRPGGLAIPAPSGTGSTPRGLLVYANGPAALTDCGAAGTTVVTASFNAVAGRLYRVETYINASQVSAVGNSNSNINVSGPLTSTNANSWITYNLSHAVGVVVLGTATFIFTATSTGPATAFIRGATNAGAFRVSANNAFLSVEDVGSS